MINHDADNLEYAQRVRSFDPDRRPGPVTRLGGCGLYRRSAVTAAGYLTDRNLHGGEELELAARLQAAGWTLGENRLRWRSTIIAAPEARIALLLSE